MKAQHGFAALTDVWTGEEVSDRVPIEIGGDAKRLSVSFSGGTVLLARKTAHVEVSVFGEKEGGEAIAKLDLGHILTNGGTIVSECTISLE